MIENGYSHIYQNLSVRSLDVELPEALKQMVDSSVRHMHVETLLYDAENSLGESSKRNISFDFTKDYKYENETTSEKEREELCYFYQLEDPGNPIASEKANSRSFNSEGVVLEKLSQAKMIMERIDNSGVIKEARNLEDKIKAGRGECDFNGQVQNSGSKEKERWDPSQMRFTNEVALEEHSTNKYQGLMIAPVMNNNNTLSDIIEENSETQVDPKSTDTTQMFNLKNYMLSSNRDISGQSSPHQIKNILSEMQNIVESPKKLSKSPKRGINLEPVEEGSVPMKIPETTNEDVIIKDLKCEDNNEENNKGVLNKFQQEYEKKDQNLKGLKVFRSVLRATDMKNQNSKLSVFQHNMFLNRPIVVKSEDKTPRSYKQKKKDTQKPVKFDRFESKYSRENQSPLITNNLFKPELSKRFTSDKNDYYTRKKSPTRATTIFSEAEYKNSVITERATYSKSESNHYSSAMYENMTANPASSLGEDSTSKIIDCEKYKLSSNFTLFDFKKNLKDIVKENLDHNMNLDYDTEIKKSHEAISNYLQSINLKLNILGLDRVKQKESKKAKSRPQTQSKPNLPSASSVQLSRNLMNPSEKVEEKKANETGVAERSTFPAYKSDGFDKKSLKSLNYVSCSQLNNYSFKREKTESGKECSGSPRGKNQILELQKKLLRAKKNQRNQTPHRGMFQLDSIKNWTKDSKVFNKDRSHYSLDVCQSNINLFRDQSRVKLIDFKNIQAKKLQVTTPKGDGLSSLNTKSNQNSSKVENSVTEKSLTLSLTKVQYNKPIISASYAGKMNDLYKRSVKKEKKPFNLHIDPSKTRESASILSKMNFRKDNILNGQISKRKEMNFTGNSLISNVSSSHMFRKETG